VASGQATCQQQDEPHLRQPVVPHDGPQCFPAQISTK
jgi:hypothetical protein